MYTEFIYNYHSLFTMYLMSFLIQASITFFLSSKYKWQLILCICKSNLLQTLDLHKWISGWMLKIHHIKGTVSEVFYFPIILWVHRRSQCVHCGFPCALHSNPFAITVHSACAHKAFTLHSPSFSVHFSFNQIILYLGS